MKSVAVVLALVAVVFSTARASAQEVSTYHIMHVFPATEADERYACAFSAIGYRPTGFVIPVVNEIPKTPPKGGGVWGMFRFACWFSHNMNFNHWERLVWFDFESGTGFINTAFVADDDYVTERHRTVSDYAVLVAAAELMVRTGCYCGSSRGAP